MTARFIDSCAAYTTAAEMSLTGYNTISAYSTSGGRWGTGAGTMAGGGAIGRAIAPSADELIIGFVGRYAGAGVGTVFSLREGATTHVDIRTDVNDRVTVTRNGTVLGTSAVQLVNGQDVVFQLRTKIHDTLGTVALYINDVLEINLTGQDTRNAVTGFIDGILWQATVSQISEIYIFDTAGTVNNAHPGAYRIAARRPSAAGNYAQWTPNASTNVSRVSDANGNDGDTTYNSSSTAAQKDSFQFGAVPWTGGTITGIMHRVTARKDDAGIKTLRPIQRQSATDYAGTTVTLTTAYAHYTEIKETNPSTTVAYTTTEMRATTPEFGYEVVA